MKFTLRQKLGALIFDAPRYIYYLFVSKAAHSWTYIKNRHDILQRFDAGPGIRCDWQWTSNLHLPLLFPKIGNAVFMQAINDCPIDYRANPERHDNGVPDVTFIIGHRGVERTPLLLKTIDSIAAQTHCHIECVVVEQDNEPLLRDRLPDWVTYQFTPLPERDRPYSRSWAFNVGAEIARADCLIFHDNDMLVPVNYASESRRLYDQGFEFINLKRFIFYLTEHATTDFLDNQSELLESSLDVIMQNAEGGGSIAAAKTAFYEIGRFDERFVGWGGEDNEFWERAETKRVWPYAYLPLVHLWHAVQPTKSLDDAEHKKNLYWILAQQSPEERIKLLTEQASVWDHSI